MADRRVRGLACAAVAASLAAGCASFGHGGGTAGLPAFHQVDEGLYRGGQPSVEGLRQLAGMGVKTVISLRQPSAASRKERELVEQLGMRWVNLPMWFWWRPSDRQIREFLDIAQDSESRPVFVHCRQGWNRAGIMVAIYRIVHQGWTPKQAYAEARQYGMVAWNPTSRYILFTETPKEFARDATGEQP